MVACYRDPKARRGGVTAKIYKEILDKYLPTLIDHDTIFIQDNALIYTSRLLQEFLEEIGYTVLKWPLYSPDLNPIKNLWFLLKEAIIKKNLGLSTMPKNNTTLEILYQTAVVCWGEFEEEMVNGLIDSMPRCVEAVIKSRGWYTKY